MKTIGELLIEKKNNCCNYLKEIIEIEEVKTKLTEEQIQKYKEHIAIFDNAPLFAFIYFIHNDLIKYRDDLKEYTNNFLKKNGIEDIEPFEKYKEKIEKYLQLFIDIIEYEEENETD